MEILDSDSSTTLLLASMRTIGLAVIGQEMKNAARVLTGQTPTLRLTRTAYKSLYWVKSRQLKKCIDYYHLQLDPDKLLGEFKNMFGPREDIW